MQNARSVSRRAPSSFSRDQTAGFAGLMVLFVCRLNAKRPRGFPAGAIPTVDFLLARSARVVKKMAVKTLDHVREKITRESKPITGEVLGSVPTRPGAPMIPLVASISSELLAWRTLGMS